ncbi:MAG: acyl carrier protein [Paludibacteraceae bacterium]|nr:acyl carrier protein [Paludibacteraceae bacterium]MEE3485336.1 phosphopantetheine-binding protein [Bacteroidales bacterium]
MDITEIKKIINDFLSNEFEIEEEQLKETAKLKDDLKIDSLDFVDIAVEVEKQFKFKITANEMSSIQTLGEFYTFISNRLSAVTKE